MHEHPHGDEWVLALGMTRLTQSAVCHGLAEPVTESYGLASVPGRTVAEPLHALPLPPSGPLQGFEGRPGGRIVGATSQVHSYPDK